MPRSVILYLNDADSMPEEEICLIRFADGTTHEYRVPVMNVQSYTTDLTEFIRECIMIIDREKENGTLTDISEKEIIEFLDMACGYLLKNEPELKKEVYGIMRPIVMTQMERAEYEIKLANERIEEEKKRLGDAIRKVIEKYCSSNQNRQEVKENIQDIFSLDEAEAEEKMEKYWVQEHK